MQIPIIHNMICDAALAVIISNNSKAPTPGVTADASGNLLTDAAVFVQVLVGLQRAGVSASNILTLITTIVDLIKVSGPDVAKIIATIMAMLSGG